MERFDYLVVGGGMTGDAAVRGIRSVDPDGSVALITAEPDPPYDRPPLSKGLWKEQEEERIWRGTEDAECTVFTGRTATSLDRQRRVVACRDHDPVGYERLLLATGGRPRKLDRGCDGILYFRTFRDYRRLREAAGEGGHFAVIGGGFIGSEIAAALAMNDRNTTLLFPEDGICRRILPGDLSRHLSDQFRERGVDVRAGAMVRSVERRGKAFVLALESGETMEADHVVAGLGIVPETTLAEASGLAVEDGIVTDRGFRTEDQRIWAAGDVARFPSSALDRSLRVEHEDHANRSGTVAGRGMAGEDVTYDHIPLFYSDLFDLGYEAVGITDPDGMEVVTDWSSPLERGVLYYLEDDRVRGILVWNAFGKAREARRILRDPGPHDAASLAGRIELD